jgi:myo-inositol-1-phosphate synthase
MDEFTNEEKYRIDALYGTDFENITPEDAQLIARYEAYKAKEDEKIQAEIKAIQDESAQRLEYAKEQQKQAMDNLNELHARALARIERMEKRERPSIEQAQKDEYTVDTRGNHYGF